MRAAARCAMWFFGVCAVLALLTGAVLLALANVAVVGLCWRVAGRRRATGALTGSDPIELAKARYIRGEIDAADLERFLDRALGVR